MRYSTKTTKNHYLHITARYKPKWCRGCREERVTRY